ncbi:outer membrane assembly lipoprotein YfiO [Sedimentisphaera cyanobacteriorum]|uniref:Outer membrane assembly lipoprotein YfiO n=1 Tax=Sedimentisphaera cyanobacteriorum TaxID=1940790 RepID=A0A1Q2HRD9_9BACT|nr:outer membrane protein assembly factor BamD [Sedimentisphaera cyanobacteriorum]AQQ10017.1 outer membrane assembly lipoprotein YfiO [Sedimentisphaera cyanobacteriorum]
MKICIPVLIISILISAHAETLVLEDTGWQPADKALSEVQLSLAEICRLAENQDKDRLSEKLEEFETGNPELSGDAWEAFAEAEMIYAQRDVEEAAEKFYEVLDNYPMSEFYQPAMEGLYQCGKLYLSGRKKTFLMVFKLKAYDEGEEIMRSIAERAGNAPIAKRAFYTLAESYEKREKYLESYNIWVEIATRWPTGEEGLKSLYEMGKNMHQAYNGPKYDSSSLKSAEGYYGQFKKRYPSEAKLRDISEKIDLTQEQQAYKQYRIAMHYYRVEDYRTALVYLESFQEDWPDSQYFQEVEKTASQCRKELEKLKDKPRIRPVDKNIFWRFAHFFDFDVK